MRKQTPLDQIIIRLERLRDQISSLHHDCCSLARKHPANYQPSKHPAHAGIYEIHGGQSE
jgi:hypothetical protein